MQRSIGSPVAAEPGDATAGERVWMQLAEIGWWILGARVAVGIVRLVVVLENKPRETKTCQGGGRLEHRDNAPRVNRGKERQARAEP
jgi:hypothetical protein